MRNRDGHRLGVFKKEVLRRMFGHMRERERESGRELYREKLNNFYSSQNTNY
jgi:hypothetical protein